MSLSKLQEIVKDREAWLAVHGVAKIRIWLIDWTTKVSFVVKRTYRKIYHFNHFWTSGLVNGIHSHCCAAVTTIHLQDWFISQPGTLTLLKNTSPLSPPPAPPILLCISVTAALPGPHTSRLEQYLPFRDWHASLSIMSSRFSHIVAYQNFHLFRANKYSCCRYVPYFVYTVNSYV